MSSKWPCGRPPSDGFAWPAKCKLVESPGRAGGPAALTRWVSECRYDGRQRARRAARAAPVRGVAPARFRCFKAGAIRFPALFGDMGAEIAGPQIAKLFPGRSICALPSQALIDALAGGVDADIVAPGHGPARQIVFALLLDRHRAGGALQPQRLARSSRAASRSAGRRDQCEAGSCRCARRPASSRAHSLSPPSFSSVLIAAGTEIENLRVAGIEAKRARRCRRAGRAHSRDSRRARCRHGRSAAVSGTRRCWSRAARCAAVGAQRALRQIARFGRPFGMVRGGIVPIHQRARDSRHRDKARPGRRNRPAR